MRPLPPSRTVMGQRGSGAAGFLLAAVPVLLLALGAIEAAHWLFLRQTAGLMASMAARAASTAHARPIVFAQAFERSLPMMFPQPGQAAAALQRRRQALDGIPWQARIMQPGPAAFADHAQGGVGDGGRIRNAWQGLQHHDRLAQGWAGGRGPRSGATIFHANTLAVELIWPQPPLVPGMRAVLRGMGALAADGGFRQRVLSQGYLPIRRTVSVAMQSDPLPWPDLPDGRVIHAGASPALPAGGPACPVSDCPPAGPGGGHAPTAGTPLDGYEPPGPDGKPGNTIPGHGAPPDAGAGDATPGEPPGPDERGLLDSLDCDE